MLIVSRLSESEEGSSGSGSGNDSPSLSPTINTSFFGQTTERGKKRGKKISIADLLGPHDAKTQNKLLQIRKMSESIQRGIRSRDGNIQTIPITDEDITDDWVRMIINQYKIKYLQPAVSRQTEVHSKVQDCKVTTPFNTIVHGECWEKNVLFKKEEEGEDIKCLVLDWKNTKIASATKDLAFFLMSSTSNELRSEKGEKILKTYFATFSRTLGMIQPETLQDPSLTYENFYSDYKISTKGALMQSVCVLLQEMQHLESQLQSDKASQIGETLGHYEQRAKNLMNDKILNQTHFL